MADLAARIDFAGPPQLAREASREFSEGTAQARRSCKHSNFLKGAKWSPDGLSLLAASEDCWLRLFDLPPDVESAKEAEDWAADVRIFEGETVYDYAWYPFMSSEDPATCVFASTSRAHPLHLWDALTGRLRATYAAHNTVDEVHAATSLAFSHDGALIFAGFDKKLAVFDLSRPGHGCREIVTKRRRQEGLPGIVSCLASCPDGSGLLAAGAYSGTAALYDQHTLELQFLLQGHSGGLTQVTFSRDGGFLYTGARSDSAIMCWDIRQTSQVLYTMQRDTSSTNQRVSFDIEPWGRYLATGSQDGKVQVFDLTDGQPVLSWQAAADTVNGVGFHPYLPLAVSASGHRRLPAFGLADDDSSSSDESAGPALRRSSLLGRKARASEGCNCLRVWKFDSRAASEADLGPVADPPAQQEPSTLDGKP